MSITIMHTADPHIDTAHHGRLNPVTGIDTAIESNVACLSHLVDKAVEEQVDLFLLAGDLTSAGRPTPETMMMLTETLAPLVAAGIPIEVDEGNHERLGISARHRTILPLLAASLGATARVNTVCESARLTHYDGVDVLTIPYPAKSRILAGLGEHRADPTAGDGIVVRHILNECERLVKDRDGGVPLVVSGHFTVSGIGLPGSEQDIANLMNEVVFPTEGIMTLDPTYVALGHIHTPQQIAGTPIFYSGSPNKLTFTDANDIKGGNLVTLKAPGFYSVSQVETPVRGMYRVDLESDAFDLDLEPGDVVQVALPVGVSDIPGDIKALAEEVDASLYPKVRPAPRAESTRTVLPEKISAVSALKTHLKDQNMSDDEIATIVTKAKALGAEGN